MTDTAAKVSYNPCSFRTRFEFTDTVEWLKAFRSAIDAQFPEGEGAAILYSPGIQTFDLKLAEWYRFRIYAERGGSEGHYVIFDVEHRQTRERIVLMSVKTFSGIAEASRIASWMTCEMFE